MDLLLNKDAFMQASRELEIQCDELNTLLTNIISSFEQLRKDWDSDEGRAFFESFKTKLIDNISDHITVFTYMRENLLTASQKYEEVFSAAHSVSNVQY